MEEALKRSLARETPQLRFPSVARTSNSSSIVLPAPGSRLSGCADVLQPARLCLLEWADTQVRLGASASLDLWHTPRCLPPWSAFVCQRRTLRGRLLAKRGDSYVSVVRGGEGLALEAPVMVRRDPEQAPNFGRRPAFLLWSPEMGWQRTASAFGAW